MGEQYTEKYRGGANVVHKGQLDQDMKDIATDLAGLQQSALTSADLAQAYGVLEGLVVADPTTPSSQLTGAGNTTWNVDVSLGSAVVNSVEKSFAIQADLAIHSGSKLLDNGQSAYAWVVLTEAAGTVAMEDVVGTPATTGAQVVPTDAEITTAVGHSDWQKLCLLLLNRTADTTVTQSQDNASYRQPFAGTLQSDLSNELKTDADAASAYTLLTTNR